jgi:tocopherol cyclase
MYQGWGKTRQYFEGWYIKVVSRDERHALAFIHGIAMTREGEQHAFVQVMHGSENKAHYHRFDAAAFQPSDQSFAVTVGTNHFSEQGMTLELPGYSGSLRFTGLTHWPKMLGAPGIMGWYGFVPFMECFHGIVSMHHELEGVLYIDGEAVDFTGGRGYIEKDWGRSFPKAYVWMQSNHFGDAPASLMASVAHIPWLGSAFVGFISGFWLEGRLFRFATYTGARKRLLVHDDTVEVNFKNPRTELRILAHKAEGVALISPLSGGMTGKVNESLQASIEVALFERGHRIFEGTGTSAGLEVAGDLSLIVDKSI